MDRALSANTGKYDVSVIYMVEVPDAKVRRHGVRAVLRPKMSF